MVDHKNLITKVKYARVLQWLLCHYICSDLLGMLYFFAVLILGFLQLVFDDF